MSDDPLPSPAQNTTTTTNNRSARDIEAWRRFFYTTSLGLCVACPAIALLPPRKLDLYTFGLGVAWFMSAGFVVEQKTGQGLLWHVGTRIPSVRNRERAEELAREEAEWRERRGDGVGGGGQERKRGFLRRIWMGGERDDWVEERKRREREALEEGRGYGGLIMDQIKEVWGVRKDGEDEEENETEQKREESLKSERRNDD